MRGSENEIFVLNCLRRMDFVSKIIYVGIIDISSHCHVTCSPDEIVLFRAEN